MYEEIKDIVKSLKCNCFKIFPDRIMGTDSNIFPISYMSVVFGDFSNYETGMYYITSKGEIFKHNSFSYSMEEYLYDSFMFPMDINHISNVLLKEKGKDIPCLEGKKASDGLCITILDDNWLIGLFKGFIPYTKPDECIARIYQDGVGFIVEFVLIKKKFTLNKFVRYIPVLNR